jgi:type II secretory pathway pseudopilin PulG
MKESCHSTENGFTLVELAIVFAIIAMIMGGVVLGKNLITQFQLKSIIKEYQYYKAAVLSFKEQYGQLPGDFNDASTVWPNCPNVNGTIANCNGNNDGLIPQSGQLYTDEAMRAWQHLSLAALIEGNYTGFHTTLSQNDIGINVPDSKWPGVGWYFDRNLAGIIAPNYINAIFIGGFSANSLNSVKFLTPPQAAIIDNKIDDGGPITGIVRGYQSDLGGGALYGGVSAGTACAVSATNTYNTGAAYINTKICGLAFALGV